MAISFFDMAVNLTPPQGHFEPMPLTLGPNWQPNDVRILMVSGAGSGQDTPLMMPMTPDPPAGFTAAYVVNPGEETLGVYWRRLTPGDTDTSVAWPKPPGWRYFVWSTLTARGVDPAQAPVAGRFAVSYTTGDDEATASPIPVPDAGVMVLCVGTTTDVGGSWPSWAAAMGVPIGWTHLVATEKSGDEFDSYATESSIVVAGKSYTGAGSTGAVSIPIAVGAPMFTGLYVFIRPASDVTIAVGAA